MNWQKQSHRLTILLGMVAAITAGLLRAQGPASAPSGADKLAEKKKELKDVYKFSDWVLKVKKDGLVPALTIKGKDFEKWGELKAVSANADSVGFMVFPGDNRIPLMVSITRYPSTVAAREAVIDYLLACSAPPPAFIQPPGSASVGDVCFVPATEYKPKGADTPVTLNMLFVRNNVYVRLTQLENGKPKYWDMLKAARDIDDLLTTHIVPPSTQPAASQPAKRSAATGSV